MLLDPGYKGLELTKNVKLGMFSTALQFRQSFYTNFLVLFELT